MKLFHKLFLIAVFVPFISPVPAPSVTQPIAFFFSLSIIFFNYRKLKINNYFVLLIIPLVTIYGMYFICPSLSSLKSVVGYTSLFCICTASYVLLKNNKFREDDLVALLHKVIIVWFLIAFLQKIGIDLTLSFKHSIWDGIVGGRGVSSLATEPSYYGTICVFVYIILHYLKKLRIVTQLFLLFQIVVLAQSTISLLYLILFHCFIGLKNLSIKLLFRYFIVSSIVVTISIFIINRMESSDFRMLILIKDIISSNPEKILLADLSLNHRFQHIYFSILGSIDNNLIPQSINNWPEFYNQMVKEYRSIVIWAPLSPTRIMSGFGSAVFELGVLSFFYFWIVFKACASLNRSYKRGLFDFAFISLLMFSAIPFVFPPFGFLIAFLFSVGSKKTNFRGI